MYSSNISTSPLLYTAVFYPPSETSHEEISIPLLPSDFGSLDKKEFPSSLPTLPSISLLSSQLEAANMGTQNVHYHHRTNSGAEVPEYSGLGPWYTCMYPAEYQETPVPSTRASVSSSVYNSPPTLSLSTNHLGISAPYAYSAHPDSGIQVTPQTATVLSASNFGSAPPSAGGINMPRSSTPGSVNSPMPMLGSSCASSVSDATEAWEAHQAARQHHQQQYHHIERASTFDSTNWRIPAYPDVNIVQPTPINATASYQWPEAGNGELKHRSTGLANDTITGRYRRFARLVSLCPQLI